jgi:hypothetical protein
MQQLKVKREDVGAINRICRTVSMTAMIVQDREDRDMERITIM